jgi:hypothetical protein
MQHTPLLMRQLVERGAIVAPNEEIVTAQQPVQRVKPIRKQEIAPINWRMPWLTQG